MCANLYHLKDLTEEEEHLLKDPKKVVKILLSPLSYLVKKDARSELANDEPLMSPHFDYTLVDNYN